MAEDHRRPVREIADDPGFLREIAERGVLQELLEAEMTEHVGAARYERAENRKGHATATSPGSLEDAGGHAEPARPPGPRRHLLHAPLRPLPQRNEKALRLALMEMYVEGVSTGKVEEGTARNRAARASPRAPSLASPAPWMPNPRRGGADRWRDRPTPTCSWTPATRRCAWAGGW